MTEGELVKAAINAIGQGAPEDYKIAPRDHAKLLADKAPALAEILESSEVAAIVDGYDQDNSDAESAQQAFRATAKKANVAVFAATCLGAAILVTVPLVPHSWVKAALIVLSICSLVCGALASMWLFKVREGNLLEKWMTARAAAETMRLNYFLLITNAPSLAASAIPLPLLQLEYFRRYQLEIQRAFYRNRGRDHERDAGKMLGISAFAVLMASVAAGLGGFLAGAAGPGADSRWVALAALGTFAAALSSFASAQESLGQDRRNADLYSKTLEALNLIWGRIDRVRNSAARGEQGPVQEFVAAVHEQLSLEHRQWMGAEENTKAALGRLDEALKDGQAKALKAGESK